MSIRPFDFTRDLERVLDLWEDAGPGVRLSKSDTPEEIQKKLDYAPDLFLVYERESILGAVLGGYDGRRGLIYHLAVDKGHRGQGIGKVLMEALEARLKARGCLKYYLLVTRDNPEALDFYQKIGCELMDLHLLGKVLQ